MEITFLYFDGCPSHEEALQRLHDVLAEEGIAAEIEIIQVETEENAIRKRFVGSPTILIEGRDIDPLPEAVAYGLACRGYQLEDGRISPLPSKTMIRKAVKAAKLQH
jgi:hypothetical protein